MSSTAIEAPVAQELKGCLVTEDNHIKLLAQDEKMTSSSSATEVHQRHKIIVISGNKVNVIACM